MSLKKSNNVQAPKEYSDLIRSIYTTSREEARRIKNKSSSVDPIVQNSSRYDLHRPKIQNATIEYLKNTSERDEKLRRKHIPIETHVFRSSNVTIDEIDQKGHRRKPLEKIIINHDKDDKPRCRKKFPQMERPSNVLFQNYQTNLVNPATAYKKTRRNMYNPKSCEDILDEVPAKFRAENQKKNSLSKSVYMDANRARLFPDSIIKEKSANVSIRVNRKTNHHKVPDTPATRDNLKEIFNSKIYANAKEQKITPKINYDNFETFSSSAKKVTQERYKYM